MNIFTVSFFGHRTLNDCLIIEERLEQIIRELLLSKDYVEFLIGRDGEFDQLAASTIRRCKRAIRDDNSTLVLTLPYMTKEYKNNTDSFHQYYDEIEVSSASTRGYFKAAHQSRNRSMVDRSDLVVFCIQHSSGGAYQTMRYAIKTGVKHINLSKVTNDYHLQ